MCFKRTALFFTYLTFFVYATLIVGLCYFSSMEGVEILFSGRILYAVGLSFVTATISTVFAVLVGVPVAYALSRLSFPLKKVIDILLELPMIVSPVALGAMLLIFFNNPLGKWVQSSFGNPVFTVYGVVLAQLITILGVMVRLAKTVFDGVPYRFELVSRTLGASPFKAFYTTTLPIAAKGLLSSSILVWAKALGEFGATITIAGSMAFKTETLPIAIYMKLAVADIPATVSLILLLIFIGLLSLYLIRFTFKREHAYN